MLGQQTEQPQHQADTADQSLLGAIGDNRKAVELLDRHV